MNAFRYRIIVEWSNEDESFIARVPALHGCAAHGDSPDEATREAWTAAAGILASLRDHGDPVPPEDVASDFSGQLRLRLPSSLHERLTRLAAAEGVSLNQELVAILAEGCGSKAPGHATPPSKGSRPTRSRRRAA